MGVRSWLRDNLRDTDSPPVVGSEARQVSRIYFETGEQPASILSNFPAFVAEGYAGNGPLFSLIAIRMKAFSEAGFLIRDIDTHEVSTRNVPLLRKPWTNANTSDMLAIMELDNSLAGAAFIRRRTPDKLSRLRPDLVDVITGLTEDGSRDLLGYLYWPHGRHSGKPALPLLPDEVASYIEHPDAYNPWVGQSWITAISSDGDADSRMTGHKNKFFDQGAQPGNAIMVEGELSKDQKEFLQEQFQDRYAGWENAYKTILLEGGAKIVPLGHSFEQMQFSVSQSAGETRMAAAAGVPPVVVGFLQGIQAATYSNYAQALRRFADLTIRPKWKGAAGALETVLNLRPGQELWYDDRDIPFLQQDEKDAAEIRKQDSLTLEALVRTGWTPESALSAVISGKFDILKHTGLVSVQLQPPGTDNDTPTLGSSDDE